MSREKISGDRDDLRSGYTTGSCAAAAAKAAALALVTGKKVDSVAITLPGGEEAVLPVSEVNCRGNEASASVIKDAGDDPDVTDGLVIKAKVVLNDGDIKIEGGEGVGKVTKPGLQVPVGEPAVNPVPRSMITGELKKVLPSGGALVTIEVPGAKEIVHKTLNSRLGIEGGISILGTSGIVHPMSDDAYMRSLVPQVDQALALGWRHVVLTPGRMGAEKAKSMGFPQEAVVQTSNYIGDLLKACVEREIEGVILLGHIGKLLKVASGIFITHSRLADARRETLAAHAAMAGAGQDLVREIMVLNTADESVSLLREAGLMEVYYSVAESAGARAEQFCDNKIKAGTILYNFSGDILGYDRAAEEIGGKLGWRVK